MLFVIMIFVVYKQRDMTQLNNKIMKALIKRFTLEMKDSDLADICTIVGEDRFKRFDLFYTIPSSKIKLEDLETLKPCEDRVESFINALPYNLKSKVIDYLMDYFPDTYRERTFFVTSKNGNWHKTCKSKKEEYSFYSSFDYPEDVSVIFN